MNRTKRRLCAAEALESKRLLSADLSVQFDAVPQEVTATEEITYVVRVTNDGPDDVVAAHVVVDDGGLEGLQWSRQGPFEFPPMVDLTKLDGENGFVFERGGGGTLAGDINADGFEDLVVTDNDFSYVLFGDSNLGQGGRLAAEDLNGMGGFVIENVELGLRQRAGDINGDAIDDLLVGAHVILGADNVGQTGHVNVYDPSAAIRITTDSDCELCRATSRFRHAAAGDINGDGFDDLLVSNSAVPLIPVFDSRTGSQIRRYEEGDIGAVWVIYGHADFGRNPIDLDDLTGANGFQIRVNTLEEIEFGRSTWSVGDVNGDGFADTFITTGHTGLRVGYLVYGGEDLGENGELIIEQQQLQEGVIQLIDTEEYADFENTQIVADVNRDGFDDLLLSDRVIYGRDGPIATGRMHEGRVDVSRAVFNDQIGFHWESTPRALGDPNGDGIADYVLGGGSGDQFDDGLEHNGEVFVFFGQDGEVSFKPDYFGLDGGNGFAILGVTAEERIVVRGASGDYNGDGIDDLVIGGRAGQSYIVFGSQSFARKRQGPVDDRVDIPAGGEVVYRLTGTVPFQISGEITGSAEIASAAEDLDPTNNTAVSSSTMVIPADPPPDTDLQVSMDNNLEQVFPGDTVTYLVAVENTSPSYAIDAHLVVDLDANLLDPSWRRIDSPGSGSGSIDQVINVPSGNRRLYEVSAVAGRGVGTLSSSVHVTLGGGQVDATPENNLAVDVDVAPQRYQIPHVIANIKPCFEEVVELGDELLFAGVPWDECYADRAQASSGFFAGDLWKTDGTTEGTELVHVIRPWDHEVLVLYISTPGDAFFNPEFVEFQGVGYFAAADAERGEELWRSDGTQDGTYLVKDIDPGPAMGGAAEFRRNRASSDIDNLLATDEWLLFAADDEVHGRELWRSDGTEEGTQLVRDIYPGAADAIVREAKFRETMDPADPERAIVFDNIYYFVAEDGTHGRELWRSDGTEDGTFMLKDIAPGSQHAFPTQDFGVRDPRTGNVAPRFQQQDGLLYFSVNRNELWQTDGTEAGTMPAGDVELRQSSIELRYGEYTIWYENGFFYRSGGELDGPEPIAAWTTLDAFQPSWIKVVGDQVVFDGSSAPSWDRPARLYAFDLRLGETRVEPQEFRLPSALGTVKSYATDVVTFTEAEPMDPEHFVSITGSGYLVEFIDTLHPYAELITAPTNVLGDNDLKIDLAWKEAITLSFPAPVVDGPGVNIQIDANHRFFVWGTADGTSHFLGQTDLFPGGINIEGFDQPLSSIRLEAANRPFDYVALRSVRATVDARYFLTAESTNNPDLEFSWDLNGDGIFGDRFGRSVGLSESDLQTFGMNEAGEYVVSVMTSDRVHQYVDTTTVRIVRPLEGDVDEDGEVSFDDFFILAQNFGKQPASRDEGDLNENSIIDFEDFVILSNNFGRKLT